MSINDYLIDYLYRQKVAQVPKHFGCTALDRLTHLFRHLLPKWKVLDICVVLTQCLTLTSSCSSGNQPHQGNTSHEFQSSRLR